MHRKVIAGVSGKVVEDNLSKEIRTGVIKWFSLHASSNIEARYEAAILGKKIMEIMKKVYSADAQDLFDIFGPDLSANIKDQILERYNLPEQYFILDRLVEKERLIKQETVSALEMMNIFADKLLFSTFAQIMAARKKIQGDNEGALEAYRLSWHIDPNRSFEIVITNRD